jgi:hypothetical protein
MTETNLNDKHLNIFFHYLKERESIRLKKVRGEKYPFTSDPILHQYKFTNILRIYDRTTQWALLNWYSRNRDKDLRIQAFNCALFRYFGTEEFAKELGYQLDFQPELIMKTAALMLAQKSKVFTGAYIVTNQGISAPKQEVVVKYFLTPFWEALPKIVKIARESFLWEETLGEIAKIDGFGPFMRKEVGLDLMLTSVLEDCTDRYTWTPAGPGAVRGLNRLLNRDLKKNMSQEEALHHMRFLLPLVKEEMLKYPEMHPTMSIFGVTDIQFSLCELDKYLRVMYDEGRPRSLYKPRPEHR